MRDNTIGDLNTASGSNALLQNTTGDLNTANGSNALLQNTTGASNTASGSNALQSNTTGDLNTANGLNALQANTTGDLNTANGSNALQSSTTGVSNTANGSNALQSNTTGDLNTANGSNALLQNTTGASNTASGVNSLQSNTTGNLNTANGLNALQANTTGVSNTASGSNALRFTVTGDPHNFSNCGGFGDSTSVSADNQVQLGNTTTTTFTFGAVQNRSDARDKTDIRDTVLGLDFINSVRPVDFILDYRDDYVEIDEEGNVTVHEQDGSMKGKRFHHGVIAQEIEEIIADTEIDFGGFQDHSHNGGSDVKSIGYTEFIAPLIKAIQELSKKVEVLEAA